MVFLRPIVQVEANAEESYGYDEKDRSILIKECGRSNCRKTRRHHE